MLEKIKFMTIIQQGYLVYPEVRQIKDKQGGLSTELYHYSFCGVEGVRDIWVKVAINETLVSNFFQEKFVLVNVEFNLRDSSFQGRKVSKLYFVSAGVVKL